MQSHSRGGYRRLSEKRVSNDCCVFCMSVYSPLCVVSFSHTHKVFSIVLWKGSNQVIQEVFTLIGTLARILPLVMSPHSLMK